MLFLLLLLRKPRMRVIYVTGRPVPESVVEYYLGLLPGVIPRQARARLHMVATHDGSARSLAEKLLERPRVLAEIRGLIPDPARSHLVPYTTSVLERDLALTLGIPLYGADPVLLPFGTKTGCRRLFEEAAVAHPIGYEDLHGLDDVIEALSRMRAAKPTLGSVIVKLNDGVAGRGNAVVDLSRLPAPGTPDERAELRRRAEAMTFERPDIRLESYLAQLERDGGIAEERVSGVELRSPSVQLRVTPAGEVELLSTHHQVLGGARPRRRGGWSCPRPTTGCSAARAARRPSAAASPPTSATPGRSPGRRPRSESGWRRGACWGASRSSSWWCEPLTARGRPTRSSSTCARAAPRTRSSRSSS